MPRITIAAAMISLLLATSPALADNGLVVKESAYGVTETIDRLEAALKSKGLTIFARVDHAAGAARTDQELRPTMLLIFGNPKLGTPLMQSAQTVGIDLPQKALAYEDADGKVFLVYNDPAYLAARHGIGDKEKVFTTITGALNNFSDAATK